MACRVELHRYLELACAAAPSTARPGSRVMPPPWRQPPLLRPAAMRPTALQELQCVSWLRPLSCVHVQAKAPQRLARSLRPPVRRAPCRGPQTPRPSRRVPRPWRRAPRPWRRALSHARQTPDLASWPLRRSGLFGLAVPLSQRRLLLWPHRGSFRAGESALAVVRRSRRSPPRHP